MFGLSRQERELARLERQARIAELQRSIGEIYNSGSGGATVGLSDPNAWFSLFGLPLASVNAQSALGHAAVYRCVFLIASAVSMLTLKCYRDADTSSESEDRDSSVARLLRERPNGRYSTTGFWRSVVSDMLLNGNGIVWIERNKAGVSVNLWWIPWRRAGVYFFENPASGEIELAYKLTLDNGQIVSAAQDDVMHFGGSPQWNLLFYLSPITSYAQTIGIALDSERFAESYYKNNAVADKVLTYPNPVPQKELDEMRDRLKQRFQGGRAFDGPMVFGSGAKLEQLKINATDAQILEARGFGVDMIGMVFGVPGHLLNRSDKATSFGKGLEELTQSFIDFSVGPHLTSIEDEVNWKLFGHRTRVARFDRDSFVRGDLKSRAEAMQTLLGGAQGPGVISQNEARRKIGQPPKDGDQYEEVLAWGQDEADPTPDPPAEPVVEPARPPSRPPAKPKNRKGRP